MKASVSNSTDKQTGEEPETDLDESSDEILELDEELEEGASEEAGSGNAFNEQAPPTDQIEQPDAEENEAPAADPSAAGDPGSDAGPSDESQPEPGHEDGALDDDEEVFEPDAVPTAAVVDPGVSDDADRQTDEASDEGSEKTSESSDELPPEERSTDEMHSAPDEPGDIESVTAGGADDATQSGAAGDGGASGLHETIQMEALDRAAIEREGQFRELEQTQPVLDNRMAPEVVTRPPKGRVHEWPELESVLDSLESPTPVEQSAPTSSSGETSADDDAESTETGRARRPTPAARPAATQAPDSSQKGQQERGQRGTPPPTENLNQRAADAERSQSLADAISDAAAETGEREIDPTSDTAPAPAEAVDPAAAPDHPAVPSQEAESLEMPDWIETSFGENYLLTVSKDMQAQTVREADFIEESLSLGGDERVLDLACGFGRHTIELVSRGHQVVGFDQSRPLLERAVEEANRNSLQVNFIHGDMRALQFDDVFDACFCWQTSFGYFDDETNLEILRRLHRALQPNGELLLQVVNRDYVVEDMPHRRWWEGTECVFLEEGEFDSTASMLHLERSFIYEDGRQPLEHDYFIRLYALHELRSMLKRAGFEPVEVSGAVHYRGDFLGSDSPHIIVRSVARQ